MIKTVYFISLRRWRKTICKSMGWNVACFIDYTWIRYWFLLQSVTDHDIINHMYILYRRNIRTLQTLNSPISYLLKKHSQVNCYKILRSGFGFWFPSSTYAALYPFFIEMIYATITALVVSWQSVVVFRYEDDSLRRWRTCRKIITTDIYWNIIFSSFIQIHIPFISS